jgi:hypothetical protein
MFIKKVFASKLLFIFPIFTILITLAIGIIVSLKIKPARPEVFGVYPIDPSSTYSPPPVVTKTLCADNLETCQRIYNNLLNNYSLNVKVTTLEELMNINNTINLLPENILRGFDTLTISYASIKFDVGRNWNTMGYYDPNSNEIVLNSDLDDNETASKRFLVHELIHYLQFAPEDLTHMEEWNKTAGWSFKDGYWSVTTKSLPTTDDTQIYSLFLQNPYENQAEWITAYVNNPNSLDHNSELYKFIKEKIFNGKEF